MTPQFLMFFDVESVGLHGEGFAVGWVVVDVSGQVLEAQRWACAPESAAGEASDRAWIAAHVPPLAATHDSPHALRAAFWSAWRDWRARGAWLVADCPWPVESGFLSACVNDLGPTAHGAGPYPLLDVMTLVAASGLDAQTAQARLSDAELPAHDPLADAFHSMRRWQRSTIALGGTWFFTHQVQERTESAGLA